MTDHARVQVRLVPEPARPGTRPAGYRATAYVRVWDRAEFSEYRLDGPSTVVTTQQEANALIRPLVARYLREKGWEHAEILEANDVGAKDPRARAS